MDDLEFIFSLFGLLLGLALAEALAPLGQQRRASRAAGFDAVGALVVLGRGFELFERQPAQRGLGDVGRRRTLRRSGGRWCQAGRSGGLHRSAARLGARVAHIGKTQHLGPVELQLQWRVDPRRTFAGVEAVRSAQQAGPRRITWFRGDARVPKPGSPVVLDGVEVGAVVHAARSPVAGAVGFALLDRPVAHPGLRVTVDGDPFRTVTVPVLHNRSLFVDAQRHAWASRAVDRFPALVPG